MHAPWEGCDVNERIVDVSRVTRFQFTHPGKGATPTISPSNDATRCFNSRTLGRVRLDFERLEEEEREFQFTHPGRGATLEVFARRGR